METKSFFIGIVATLIVILIAIGGYLLGKGTSDRAGVLPSPIPTIDTSLNAPDAFEPLSTPTPQIISTNQDNIEASIVSRNYAALEGAMVNPISVRLEASECCEPMTPENAVEQLAYLDTAEGTWDFNKEEIISDLAASFPENYSNAIVGISSDNYLVAFQLNENNQIIKISLAVDYNLLLQ